MRRVLVSNLVSLDGFIAGPNGEIDWFTSIADKEFERYAIDMINTVDTMLFGRVTYQLMASYWPTATATTDDPRIIDAMNNSSKIVFSRTLEKVEWKNSRLAGVDPAEAVIKLKQLPGKDMVIYGSGSIVSTLAGKGLIDEYHVFVSPTILGSGKAMFNDIKDRIVLKLLKAKTFSSGVVVLNYRPA